MTGPLESLKVLDFTTLLPGPYASMMLADMGADVVRIEAPQRPDMVRHMPPFDGETSAWHALLNRSKRSVALNLKSEAAVDVVKRLVSTGGGAYDIVLEQFRPGVMDRLGVGYDALKAANPRLIYCAITGYGQTGPYAQRAGHDNNYLALSGIMSHSGRRETGPPPLGVQIADTGGGSFGALTGLLAAVIARHHSGEGAFVDISMLDMSIAWHAHAVSHYLIGSEVPAAESWQLNGATFYDYYKTKDGRYLSVGSLEPKFWQGFCEAIDRPDLIQLGYLQDEASRAKVKFEIRQTLAARTLEAWRSIFAGLDVCVEPVLTVPEMIDHPQTLARQMIVDVPTPSGGHQRQVGSPFKFSSGRPVYDHIGPILGQHTADVLLEAGWSSKQVGELERAGAFG